MRRTQIYLDERQHEELTERAGKAGTTVSELIRRAIDAELSRPDDEDDWRTQWRSAVAETAGIAPYLPDGQTYVDELRAEERRRRRR